MWVHILYGWERSWSSVVVRVEFRWLSFPHDQAGSARWSGIDPPPSPRPITARIQASSSRATFVVVPRTMGSRSNLTKPFANIRKLDGLLPVAAYSNIYWAFNLHCGTRHHRPRYRHYTSSLLCLFYHIICYGINSVSTNKPNKHDMGGELKTVISINTVLTDYKALIEGFWRFEIAVTDVFQPAVIDGTRCRWTNKSI